MQGASATLSRGWRVAGAAVVGVAVLGCASPSSAPASSSPSASATVPLGSPSASATQAAESPSPRATRPSLSPVAGPSFDPAAELDTTFNSRIFRPAFRVSLPADWVPIERDAAAFQIYLGNEEYEITIDHTYQQAETAEAAMARLLSAPSLTAQGSPQPITIGGQAGQTVVVDAASSVMWSDSGYHTNVPGLRVRLATIPVEGGETVSIFVVANTSADDFAAVDEIALRILSTLEWVAPT